MLLTALLLILSEPAIAKKRAKDEGVLLSITVLDSKTGAPIPTAVIKHPDEVDPHRVNEVSGKWQATELFFPDGREMPFLPGTTIQLEVSAPNYITNIIQYDIRSRRNNVPVPLVPMDLNTNNIEIPIIPFPRDQERSGGGVGPAN